MTEDGEVEVFVYVGTEKPPKDTRRMRIGGNVKSIPAEAFVEYDFAEVDFTEAESLQSIGKKAFTRCIFLKHVRLPPSLKRIESGAFMDCINITEVEFGGSLEHIGKVAFYGCLCLKEVHLPPAVNRIESGLFCSCDGLTKVTFGDSVQAIGKKAFARCQSLTQVHLPPNLNRIEAGAFIDCIKLEEVTFGGSISFIGDVAFYCCESLKEVNIPPNLNRIEPGTFCSCDGMIQVTFNKALQFIGNAAFAKCMSLKRIELPPNLVRIDSDAFHSCKSIAEVTFGQSLESIGSAAFANCERLKEAHFPPSLNRIETRAFLDCVGMTEVSFNKSLQVVGIQAFQHCGLIKVALPPSLQVIENCAFSSCKSLIEADFSNVKSLEKIGKNVLRGCSSIQETLLPSTTSGAVAIHDFLNTGGGRGTPSYVVSARVSSAVVREDSRAFETARSKSISGKRPLFLGRYELALCPPMHKSTASIIVKAWDTKMIKCYEREFDRHRADESANELTKEQFTNALRDMTMVQTDSIKFEEYIAQIDSSISREEFTQFCLEKFGQKVALKFMRKKGQYLLELNRRSAKELDKRFVVPVIQNHDEDTNEELASQLNDALGHHLPGSESTKYRHIIVMPFADRTLDVIFRTERPDLLSVRKMAREIGEAVAHLHSKGLVHGDLKLSNVVQINGRISLTNLEATAEMIFGFVGSNVSSGVVPPEMIHQLTGYDETEKYVSYYKEESEEERRKRKPRYSTRPVVRGYVVRSFVEDEIEFSYENPEGGEIISTTKSKPRNDGLLMYQLVRASRAFDVWSFGALLYLLCSREPLFKVNSDDDITDGDSMRKLHNWSKLDVDTIVERNIHDKAARALLKRILKKSPAERPNMEDILQDDFFNGGKDAGQSQEVVEVMHQAQNIFLENQIATRNGFLTIRESLKRALHFRKLANDLLEGIIIKGGMVPKYFILLPPFEEGESKNGFSRFLSNLKGASLKTKARLFFVCPISLQPVLDSNGKAMGCGIVLSKGWNKRYGHMMLIGLTMVQLGLAVGRGYGLPMTGTDEDVLDLLNFCSEMQALIVESLRGDHDEGPVEILLGSINDRPDASASSKGEAMKKKIQPLKDKLQKEYNGIAPRLKNKDGELQKYGLVKTSGFDGSEEFVHPDMAPLLEKWGSKCFEMSMEELEKEKTLLAVKDQMEAINTKKPIPALHDQGQEAAEQRTLAIRDGDVETEEINSTSPSSTDTHSLQSMTQSKEGLQQDVGQKGGSIAHKGWLRIQSLRFSFRWKQRYVVVSGNGNLTYYRRATSVHDPSTLGFILPAVEWSALPNGVIELRTSRRRKGVLVFKARLSERSSSTIKDWLRCNQWMLKEPIRENSNSADTTSTDPNRNVASRVDFTGQIIKS